MHRLPAYDHKTLRHRSDGMDAHVDDYERWLRRIRDARRPTQEEPEDAAERIMKKLLAEVNLSK